MRTHRLFPLHAHIVDMVTDPSELGGGPHTHTYTHYVSPVLPPVLAPQSLQSADQVLEFPYNFPTLP